MALVGVLLGFLDRRPPTVSALVLLAVVLVPLLIQTRNSFVAVPLQWSIGLLIWLAIVRPRVRRSKPTSIQTAIGPGRTSGSRRPRRSALGPAESSPARRTPDDPSVVLGLRPILQRTSGVVSFSLLAIAFDGITAIVVARELGPAGRGTFAAALTVAVVAAALACLGIPTAGRVQLANRSGGLRLPNYLSVIPLHALLGAVTAFAFTYLFVVVALSVGSVTLAAAGAFLGAGFVASNFLFEALHALGRQAHATASNAVGSLSALVGALVAGVAQSGPTTYLLVLGCSLVFQSLVATLQLARVEHLGIRYSSQVHRRLLRAGLPALPFQVSTLATFRLDRYLVAAFVGVGAAGVYSVAATISEATRALPLSLGQVLLTGRSSGSVSMADERRARTMVLCVSWSGLGILAISAPWLIAVLFGDEYASAVAPLRLLLVAETFVAAWLIDNRLLVGSGRLGAASATTVISAAVVLIGDVVLIPPFGLMGAAAASVAAYATAWWGTRRLLREMVAGEGTGPARAGRS